MQTGYFNAAWNDIKNSPGWVGKLLVLSLVGLIPIFGWMVVFGYVFGWARDMAWNVHTPLPARVFGNEDGKLYSRGFFVLVIGFVCMLAPWVLEMFWGVATGASIGWFGHGRGGVFALFGLTSALFSLVILVVWVFAAVFAGVGSMRMSIYGRLAAGLQFGKIWAMARHDSNGLARIFGMAVVLSIAAGFALWVVTMALVAVGAIVGLVAGIPIVHTNSTSMLLAAAPGLVALVVALALACGVLAMFTSVFVLTMTVRALGYWTRQFDVPAWRGQDDPMPFELYGAAGQPGGRPPVR